MRRFLASMVAVFFCLTAAPSFAGVPVDPLSIVIGSPVLVPLTGTITVMGAVTNLSGDGVDVGFGQIINDGNNVFMFTSVADFFIPGNTGPVDHQLFTVGLIGAAPQSLPGLQFQVFTSAGGERVGTSNFFTVQTAAVPEPATLLLLGTGLAGLGGLACRRNRRR